MISTPKIIYRKEYRHFFGLISILYYIEDRRPDLPEYSGADLPEYINKYKNFIRVVIFGQEYRWTFRTNYRYDDSPAMTGRTDWTGRNDDGK